ncbi:hypothetical protein LBMAG56_29900 [Verrucomicrobiota bacterium]|nr:hypothetical protein LBMAG56_29900 [Verrucomicrobiota bacterium]
MRASGVRSPVPGLPDAQPPPSLAGMNRHSLATLLLLLLSCVVSHAAAPATAAPGRPVVIEAREFHLGTPGFPEWTEFAGKTPHGRRLDFAFPATANATACTLFLRQRDVKFTWNVLLNGRKLGALVPMETALVHALAVPPNTLTNGLNSLAIVPPTATDDIVVGNFTLDPRPLSACLADAALEVQVTEAGRRVPCRVTITEASGALAALAPLATPAMPNLALSVAARPGVVYTRDGRVKVGLLPGDYTIYASRGFEYSVATQRVAVVSGRVTPVNLAIERQVPTPGLIACDTHIHTFTYSKHGDATLDERMITIAGEGIELAVATDHNHHADYSEAAVRTRLQAHFTSVIGNEVTTKAGHFNAFPIQLGSPVVDHRTEDWPTLMAAMRRTPGVQVITLNHPRDLHSNFTPLGPTNFNGVTGANLRGPDFGFDALEVITSGAMQSDIMLLYHDWFALLNHGQRITAIGSSDTHDVSRFILGQGRTYVACPDADPGAIEIAAACRSLREGRALVSLGLLTQLRVNDRFSSGKLATNLAEEIRVEVTVLGPAWTSADRVELFANGSKIREQTVPLTTAVEKAKMVWNMPRPAHDVHLVAIATGPGVRAPFWEIPRPYQPSSPLFNPRVIGSSGVVWVDADGDGKFTAARAYAQSLVARFGPTAQRLVPALADYDRAVATQAASLCHAAGVEVRTPVFGVALRLVPPAVGEGFVAFIESLGRR